MPCSLASSFASSFIPCIAALETTPVTATVCPTCGAVGPLFEGPGADSRTRVTYDRPGWNTFVERVERSSGGAPYALLLETRFERKD